MTRSSFVNLLITPVREDSFLFLLFLKASEFYPSIQDKQLNYRWIQGVFLGFFVRFNFVLIFRIFRDGWNWGCTYLFSIPLKLWSDEISFWFSENCKQFDLARLLQSRSNRVYMKYLIRGTSSQVSWRNNKNGTIKKIYSIRVGKYCRISLVTGGVDGTWKCVERASNVFNLLELIIDDSSSLEESKDLSVSEKIQNSVFWNNQAFL